MSSFSIVASNVAVGNAGTSTHCFRTLASGQLSLGRDNTALESNVVILGKLSLSGLSTGTALISDAGANISSSDVTATELGYVSGVTSALQTQLAGKQPTIIGAATTVTSSNLTASRAMVSDSSGKVGISSVTTTELGYVSGVTSGIQTQLDDKESTITGAASTVTSSNLTASRAMVSDSSGKVGVSSVTAAELGYLSGTTGSIQTQIDTINGDVTSGIQTQLDGKQSTITGAATTVTSSNLTASRAMVSDSSGKVGISSVTATQLGYVSGVTSAIQTQLGGKQPTITGAATTVTSSNLTASRAMVSDSGGKVGISSVTAAELGYLSGTTGSIQTQIDTINGGAGTGTNLALSGNLTAAGNVTATGYILGNGALLSGVATTSGTNLTLSGNLSATGNIVSGGSVVAQTGNFAAVNISASGITTGSLAVLGDLSASSLTMGSTSTLRQVTEILNAKTGATGVVAHDFTTGAVFYHSSIAANFTCNLTNVPTTDSRTIAVTLILDQGATPYMCTAFQIGGVAQTLKWQGGPLASGTASKTDFVTFSLVRTGAAWQVFAQTMNFG
jgi:hypothetical protein